MAEHHVGLVEPGHARSRPTGGPPSPSALSLSAGSRPLPMKVSATGMPVARTNSRSAGAAFARITPLPASATGWTAPRIRSAARSSSRAGGSGQHRALARQRLAVDLGGHHVLGQLDVRGARLLGLGHLERLAHDLGDDLRVLHARVPLRDRAHHPRQVDVLVRLLVHPLEVALAGERHERRAVEVGVRHRGHEVERARAERAEADAGAAGEPAPDVGHVGAALLVADRDELDRRARQRLVQVERLLARNAEHVLDALGLEALHEDVAGFALGHGLVTVTSRSWPPWRATRRAATCTSPTPSRATGPSTWSGSRPGSRRWSTSGPSRRSSA